MKTKKSVMLLVSLTFVLMLSQCASFNKSHTSHFAGQQQMVQQGKEGEVAKKLEIKARKGGRDGLIHALQAGYYFLFMQNYDKSQELFRIAENHIEKYEERAKVNARDLTAKGKAAVSSDMELPYKGDTFEKIMVNTMLAVNHLLMDDIEGANVEIRRAELRQKEAEEKHQKELKKIEKQKKKKKVDERSLNSIYKKYDILDEYASKVVNSFQNSFTYYLGGLVYELNNKPEDAYKDYYKCFSLNKNKFILEKLIEISKKLDRKDDLKKWNALHKKLFQGNGDSSNKNADSNAELVVVYFCGSVPQKTQAKFALWLPKKSFNVAFPYYDKNKFPLEKRFLEINQNGNTLGKTELVLNFIPIAVKALKEKLPGIVVRQVIRLIAKNTVEKEAGKRGGLFGKYAAKLLNTVTERADLRGWYELPCNIQIFRTKIIPGQSTICLKEISDSGDTTIKDIDLEISDNGTAILFVHQLASKISTHSVVLHSRPMSMN
jgi:uncharacterized protein